MKQFLALAAQLTNFMCAMQYMRFVVCSIRMFYRILSFVMSNQISPTLAVSAVPPVSQPTVLTLPTFPNSQRFQKP